MSVEVFRGVVVVLLVTVLTSFELGYWLGKTDRILRRRRAL
jgi:hypothetical protein